MLLSSSLPGHRGRVNGSDLAFFQHHLHDLQRRLVLRPADPRSARRRLGPHPLAALQQAGRQLRRRRPGQHPAPLFRELLRPVRCRVAGLHHPDSQERHDPVALSLYRTRDRSATSPYDPQFKNARGSGSYEYVSPIDGIDAHRRLSAQPHLSHRRAVLRRAGRSAGGAGTRSSSSASSASSLLVMMIGSLGWSLAGAASAPGGSGGRARRSCDHRRPDRPRQSPDLRQAAGDRNGSGPRARNRPSRFS